MSAFGTAIGKVLRLVGISSPEDAAARPKAPAGAPSWRDAQHNVQPAAAHTDIQAAEKPTAQREDSGAD